jgi:ribosome-binding protein aMBF1 (putative translation factor)
MVVYGNCTLELPEWQALSEADMKRIRVERDTREWTRTELGGRAHVHPARVGQIEAGRVVPRSDSVELKRLARALGWKGDPAELLEEVEE